MEESPLPCELLILLKLVMNGSNHAEPSFSLPVKALAQIILYNHKIHGRRRESSGEPHQRHKADKESPILPYIGLKVFSATRSSVIIDILHGHGLCVSCDRILRITQGLREALLQHFHDDNADISKSQYHGTSMLLFHQALMTSLKETTSNLLRCLLLEAKK